MRLSASQRLSAFVLLPIVWYAHVSLSEFGDPALVLMANDPYSSLALPLYPALGVANLAILKRSGPPGGEPLRA